MSSVWVIVQSEHVDPDPEYGPSEPTVCGIYKTKREAVEEVLRLYIEDDIYMYYDPSEVKNSETSDKTTETESVDQGEAFDYRPDPEEIKAHRKRLLDNQVSSTYTNRGNIYTMVESEIGIKAKFSNEVLEYYGRTL